MLILVNIILTFRGVNYRANLWVNGALIDQQTGFAGTFRYFEFNIAANVKIPGPNTIAIEIYRPIDLVFPLYNNSTDLAISFVDWTRYPADSNMGLWRNVQIENINK